MEVNFPAARSHNAAMRERLTNIPRGLTVIAALALAVALPLRAEVYQWVDKNGVRHFSETKPVGADYSTVAPPRPPEDPQGAQQDHERLQQQVREAEQAREDRQNADATRAADQSKKTARCEQARAQLQALNDAIPNRAIVPGANGEPERINPEQYDERLKQWQQEVDAACG